MVNSITAHGAGYSMSMDFRGPDRNPDLGDVVAWARTGTPPLGSRIATEVARGTSLGPPPADVDDESEEDLYEAGWKAALEYRAAGTASAVPPTSEP
jgi:hypothetical protein